MTTEQIVRSWKDEEYRLSLSDQEQALLPSNPAGLVELTDDELLGIEGGSDTVEVCASIVVTALGATIIVSLSLLVSYGATKLFNCMS